MFNNVLELQDQIHYYGLDEVQELITSIARPAAAISRTYQDDDTIPIGASKMGGCPDVPIGFEWPSW